MQIKDRMAAATDGDTRYWTGRPCRNGHYSERYVRNGACCECQLSATAAWNARFGVPLRAAGGLAFQARAAEAGLGAAERKAASLERESQLAAQRAASLERESQLAAQRAASLERESQLAAEKVSQSLAALSAARAEVERLRAEVIRLEVGAGYEAADAEAAAAREREQRMWDDGNWRWSEVFPGALAQREALSAALDGVLGGKRPKTGKGLVWKLDRGGYMVRAPRELLELAVAVCRAATAPPEGIPE